MISYSSHTRHLSVSEQSKCQPIRSSYTMSDPIDQLYRPVLEKTNLRLDPTGQQLVIDIPSHANIGHDTIGCHAKGKNASKTALIFEDLSGAVEKYTFAELHTLALRFAKGLKNLGVQRGDVVAVHTGQRPETAIAHAGIHYLGGIVLTLSQLYGPDTVEHILKDSKCKIIISESAAWASLRKHRERFESLEHCILNKSIESERLPKDWMYSRQSKYFAGLNT